MELRVVVRMDNAAFEPESGPEVARILRELARRIEAGELSGRGESRALRDVNGNTVGSARLS